MESSSDGDRPWQSYHTVYTNAKAGMDGVDKERVQKIVYEMSKGSKYFANERRKEAYIKQKIHSLRVQLENLTEKDISQFQNIADRRISEMKSERDLSKVWLHSDMDAFYAAVETLENPQLEGKPLAVGSMSMICTANYEARKFGVRAAMPGFIACRLCPELVLVPTNFKKYTFYSELTRKVFQKYDPCFITTSLDEAYLNITGICIKRGVSGSDVATELRNAIYDETGLTCSAGVAPNRLLAKVCSDINKPNGQYVLPNDRRAILAFISSLPIRKIGGIGKVTENILNDVLGINNCEQMLQKSSLICALFSRCSADFFLSVGLGLGGTTTPQLKSRKSMSNERTFSATDNEKLLFQKLEEIAESLSHDMQKESLHGRTLTLKLKTTSFEVRTRALSLRNYIQSKEDILNNAIKLLKAELPQSLRLIGLRMSQFQDGNDATQKTLTNFFIPRHASNPGHDNFSKYLEFNDKKLMGLEDGNSFSDEILSNCDPFCSEDPVDSSDSSLDVSHTYFNSDEVYTIRSMEAPVKANNIDELSESDIRRDDIEAEDQLSWIDDYICSLCGIELPPSFIDERQEHADYHIAKILQEKENTGSPGGQSCLHRFAKRKKGTREIPRKQQKSSTKDCKCLPIDSFFVRSAK